MNIFKNIFKRYDWCVELFVRDLYESLEEVKCLMELLASKGVKNYGWVEKQGKIIVRFSNENSRNIFLKECKECDVKYYATATYKCYEGEAVR